MRKSKCIVEKNNEKMMKAAKVWLLAFGLILFSCSTPGDKNPIDQGQDIVTIDKHFNELFMGECWGFTGGDGTYSVALPDGRMVWIFGDTFIDGVNPDNTREKQDPKFVRNSIVVQDGDSLRTLYQSINGRNASFAIPPNEKEEVSENLVWFWPGDGFIEDDQLKIFYSEFTQLDTGMWDFEWLGTWIGNYSLPDLEEESIIKIADNTDTHIHYGHAVHVDKIHTYVYGAGEGKPHVARYLNGDVSSPWEYYDGKAWSRDGTLAKAMADIQGSEQFSIFKEKDMYILVTQMGMLSPEICSFTAKTPYGPWGNKRKLYTAPLPDTTHNLLTYNALAHPQNIVDGKILLSYNTNSSILGDHYRDASIYRPRFVRVPMNMIENSQKK